MHPYFTKSYGSFLKDTDQFNEELIEIKKQYNANSELTPFLVLMDLMEGRVYDQELNEVLRGLRKLTFKYGVQSIFLLDGDFEYLSTLEKHDDIIYSNFLVLSTFYHTIQSTTQKVNQSWNHASSKGLYLPGKLARPHRINLLAKLWKKGLLDKLTYSCQILSEEENLIRSEFLKYDDATFTKFKLEISRVLDLNYVGKSQFESHGYPYDVDNYANTSFSIITESDFAAGIDGKICFLPKLTEKTYRTIANRHPFIHCWYPGIVQRTEKLGFKSFKEYLTFPNYNEIEDLHERINVTIENIKHFDSAKNNFTSEITRDVEYNFQRFRQLLKIEVDKLSPILSLPQSQDPDHKKTLRDFVHFMFPIPHFKP